MSQNNTNDVATEAQNNNHGDENGYIQLDELVSYNWDSGKDGRYKELVSSDNWNMNLTWHILNDTQSDDLIICKEYEYPADYKVVRVFDTENENFDVELRDPEEWEGGISEKEAHEDALENVSLMELIETEQIEGMDSSEIEFYSSYNGNYFTVSFE